MFKFFKEYYFPIFLILFCFSLPYLPYNRYILLIISLSFFIFLSFVINEYLSNIIPEMLHKITNFFNKQNPFLLNLLFALSSIIVWNFSLYIPDKIFNIFTAALVFIPNFLCRNNRVNEVFKILLIYAALQILEYFKLNNLIPGTNKYHSLISNVDMVNINTIFISIFEAVLYTKFYFFSLKILDECINITYKDKEHKEEEHPN